MISRSRFLITFRLYWMLFLCLIHGPLTTPTFLTRTIDHKTKYKKMFNKISNKNKNTYLSIRMFSHFQNILSLTFLIFCISIYWKFTQNTVRQWTILLVTWKHHPETGTTVILDKHIINCWMWTSYRQILAVTLIRTAKVNCCGRLISQADLP